ncbi:unnamed protein product [Camellia sinensis]
MSIFILLLVQQTKKPPPPPHLPFPGAPTTFLSFRGKDLRKTFIDHLHTALSQSGIHTFRDDDEIERGQVIDSELRKAIKQSRVSIIVFSKGYASSKWCLDELVKIVECNKTSAQVVLPVFYDVDLSQVRNQTGTFGEAFDRHEEESETAESDGRKKERMEMVKRWREALTEVTNLRGKVLQNEADGALTKLFPAPDEVNLATDAFATMQKLTLLQLNYMQLNGCYKEFPKELRWLCWHGFPLKSIPSDFNMESLVALDMQNSSLTRVWKGTKLLKFLNLGYSHSRTKTPDFSGLPSLERLVLKYCVSLVKVYESIGVLEKLVCLNLRGCKSLRKLPREIGGLKSLEKLILSGCSNLESLLVELEKLESLTVLHAHETAIIQSCLTTRKGDSWPLFFWSMASKPSKNVNLPLLSLPCTLVKLRIGECNLIDDFSGLSSLLELDLSLNPISSLPESIKNLTMLKSLYLDTCGSLQSLPELPSSLKEIILIDCKSLERMTMLPSLLKSLDFMLINGCNKLIKVNGLFKLEPIGNLDAKIIKKLGFVDLESFGNNEVELCNNLTFTREKGPLQGLFEFGIFSTFFPGSGVTDYSDRHEAREFYDFYIKISNKTRGLEWTYGPMFYGNEQEDMILLSHWNVGNQFEGGDQVNVSMVVGLGFQVKECGIDLVYDQEEKCTQSNYGKELIQHSAYYQNVIDGDLSPYQRGKGVYVLSHYDLYPDLYPPPQNPRSDCWDDPSVYDPSIWCPIFYTVMKKKTTMKEMMMRGRNSKVLGKEQGVEGLHFVAVSSKARLCSWYTYLATRNAMRNFTLKSEMNPKGESGSMHQSSPPLQNPTNL